MKQILACLSLVLALSACTDAPVIDLEEEFADRPTITLTTEDESSIPMLAGDFCSNAVCNTVPEINYETLNYVPFSNTTPLTLSIEWAGHEIEALDIRTYDSNGNVTHRNIDFTKLSENIFEIESPLPNDETNIALHVRVDFVEEGVSNYYFPLQLQ